MTFSVDQEQVVPKSSIAARLCRYRGELTGSMRFSNGPHKQETCRLTSHDSQETSPNCYAIQARVLISCIPVHNTLSCACCFHMRQITHLCWRRLCWQISLMSLCYFLLGIMAEILVPFCLVNESSITLPAAIGASQNW